MNLKLPEIESDLTLWLGVLADNELDREQRLQLIEYLESHPQHWRAAAVAMLDQQSLSESLADDETASETFYQNAKPESELKGEKSLRRKLTPVLAIAAVVLAFAGGLATAEIRRSAGPQEAVIRNDDAPGNTPVSGWLYGWEASNGNGSLCNLYPDNPLLIEIENNDDRAVFLTDRPVSDGMLECFLAAGHQVEITPYNPRIKTRWLKSLRNPVLAVEIQKYKPQLFAQGDIR